MRVQMTLSLKEVQAFASFIKEHELSSLFIAKDQGCNPETNEDWHDECRYKFGGDDFGEHLNVKFLLKAAEEMPSLNKPRLRITVTSTSIKSAIIHKVVRKAA